MESNQQPWPDSAIKAGDSSVSNVGDNRTRHDALEALAGEAQRRAWMEEYQDRRCRIVRDSSRITRRARALQEELAPTMLSSEEFSAWKQWYSIQFVPGAAMRRGIAAERRLAPEAATFEERMEAVLLKYANLPLGAAGHLIMPQYWSVVDVAAEAVEQAAYPGTAEARKRYALALRRCVREMRDARGARDRSAGRAMWRARVTLELSLDDGTLGLWNSSQALVDSVGLKADGSSQDCSEVSAAAWSFIWDYAVVSRLRRVWPECFAGVADNREYNTDQGGRILDNHGEPLVWTWDGMGSGILNGEAGVNTEAERALKEAMEETGATRILSLPNWADSYEESPEYRALCIKQAILCEGTTAVACEVLADLLDRGFGIPRLIAAFKWDELDDEGFERLIFNLVSAAPGYSNVRWMTSTRAPDRGRDISATKTIVDPLSGSRHLHVVFQCKHWLSRSIAPDEVAKLVSQMELSARPVEELVIATSGRFSSDAEQWVEKHNYSRKVPRVDLWPNSHLESLIAQRPA